MNATRVVFVGLLATALLAPAVAADASDSNVCVEQDPLPRLCHSSSGPVGLDVCVRDGQVVVGEPCY